MTKLEALLQKAEKSREKHRQAIKLLCNYISMLECIRENKSALAAEFARQLIWDARDLMKSWADGTRKKKYHSTRDPAEIAEARYSDDRVQDEEQEK